MYPWLNFFGLLFTFCHRTLTRLSLPASLDALSKPIGLPPSLVAKAEEVRNDNAPQKLQIMSENIQSLADRDDTLLNEVS